MDTVAVFRPPDEAGYGSSIGVNSRSLRRRPTVRVSCALIAISAFVLSAAGCGGGGGASIIGRGQVQVTLLSLVPASGFPGPPDETLVIRDRQTLRTLARFVPSKLPALPSGYRQGLRVCFPMDLTIGLSNGDEVKYPSCQRPRSLLRLVGAMCPLMHKPGLCFHYRNELG